MPIGEARGADNTLVFDASVILSCFRPDMTSSPIVLLSGITWRFEVHNNSSELKFVVVNCSTSSVRAVTSIVVRVDGNVRNELSDAGGHIRYVPGGRSTWVNILSLADIAAKPFGRSDSLIIEITMTVIRDDHDPSALNRAPLPAPPTAPTSPSPSPSSSTLPPVSTTPIDDARAPEVKSRDDTLVWDASQIIGGFHPEMISSGTVLLAGNRWEFQVHNNAHSLKFVVFNRDTEYVHAVTSIVVRLNGKNCVSMSDRDGLISYGPGEQSAWECMLRLSDIAARRSDNPHSLPDTLDIEITMAVTMRVAYKSPATTSAPSSGPCPTPATAALTAPSPIPTTAPTPTTTPTPTTSCPAPTAAPPTVESTPTLAEAPVETKAAAASAAPAVDWGHAVASLLFNATWSDGEIDVGGELIPIHRFVLAVQAPALGARFASNRTVKLDGWTTLVAVRRLLRYLYTGEWRQSPSLIAHSDERDVMQLISLAKAFDIQPLLDECFLFLGQTIDASNVVYLFVATRQSRLGALREMCMQWLVTDPARLRALMGSESARHLERQDLVDIIDRVLSSLSPSSTAVPHKFCV